MQIKPCKKCGGQTYHIIHRGNCLNDHGKGVNLKCPRCGYETSIWDNEFDAIMEWNDVLWELHNGNKTM